jgi:hypothetical protein
MAVNLENQELIWEGRIQLGDEPGTFGDAQYSGIATELPLMIRRTDPTNLHDDPLTFALDFEHVQIFGNYPGHHISLFIYVPDPAQQYHSIEQLLTQSTVTPADGQHKEFSFNLGTGPGPFFLSLRLRSDTSVNPGFYNDFVFTRLSEVSPTTTYYTVLGFRN